jgi:hypothetical protein
MLAQGFTASAASGPQASGAVGSRSLAGSSAPGASPRPTPDSRLHFLSRPDLTPPPVSLGRRAPGLAAGLIFFTPSNGAAPDGPMIVTDTGEPVWIHPVNGKQTTNLKVSTYRGEPVLTWWEGAISSGGIGAGEFVIADATYTEITRVHAAGGFKADLHEFLIGPMDTAIFLITNPVAATIPAPSGPIAGTVIEAVIQEIDIESGQLLFEWHSLPSIDPSESYLPAPSPGSPYDYLHANSVDLDGDGNLLLSARHTWALYKIDRGTGVVLWRMNGRKSDFTLGDGAAFAWQHDARWQPGGVSIFDDGATDQPPNFEAQSRGIVLELDTVAMTARLAQAFVHPDGLLATSQGSLQLLSTGGAFIGWGRIPRFSEFDADGELVFDASFVAGQQSYRAFRHPWNGQPAERPAVRAVRSTDGTVVYASWNGATEVAVWDILAGSQPGALVSRVKVAKSGFESSIEIELAAGVVAVRALNATGQEIGRSETVAIA